MNIQVIIGAIGAFVGVGLFLTAVIVYIKKLCVSQSAVTICINDDPQFEQHVQAGETILLTLSKQGIAIPSPCGGKASCKQCRLIIKEGDNEIFDTDRATLPLKNCQKDGGCLASIKCVGICLFKCLLKY